MYPLRIACLKRLGVKHLCIAVESAKSNGAWDKIQQNAQPVGAVFAVLVSTGAATAYVQYKLDESKLSEEKLRGEIKQVKSDSVLSEEKLRAESKLTGEKLRAESKLTEEKLRAKIKIAESSIKVAQAEAAKSLFEGETRTMEKFLMFGFSEEYNRYQQKAFPRKVKVRIQIIAEANLLRVLIIS
jgi:hypothetical protein